MGGCSFAGAKLESSCIGSLRSYYVALGAFAEYRGYKRGSPFVDLRELLLVHAVIFSFYSITQST